MSLWGPLADRYETERPRRLLALDGGGIRGIITLEILIRMENLLAEATGKGDRFRLCDFFDYIAGTSTGAIIAAGLARGMSARELMDFYESKGPVMFDRVRLLGILRSLYKSKPLEDELKKTFGEKTDLSPQNLRCLLLIVTRNATTDSPWPVSSNPLAKYNDLNKRDCNLKIPLWKLVRASTAAPIYFRHQLLDWDPNDRKKSFNFVDGGVTPYNNPAFLLYRMATLPAYCLNWKTGERNLLLISVGTGAAPKVDTRVFSLGKNHLSNLIVLPGTFMYGSLVDQDINCRTTGRCVYGAPIDSEISDLIPRDEAGVPYPISQDLGRAFLYARYNVELSGDGLYKMGLHAINAQKVGKLDAIDSIPDLHRIGRVAAGEVKTDHFGSFIES